MTRGLTEAEVYDRLIDVAARSTSNKKKVGALVLTFDNRLLAVGYNYNLGIDEECEDANGKTKDTVIHAEVACIADMRANGAAGVKPWIMVVTHEPCAGCLAAIRAAGIPGVRVMKKGPDMSVLILPKIDETLKERGGTYGTFQGNATITQGIMKILTDGAQRPLADFELEALHMVAHKMSRVVNGQKTKKDNWHDIAGYAKLAEDLTQDQ